MDYTVKLDDRRNAGTVRTPDTTQQGLLMFLRNPLPKLFRGRCESARSLLRQVQAIWMTSFPILRRQGIPTLVAVFGSYYCLQRPGASAFLNSGREVAATVRCSRLMARRNAGLQADSNAAPMARAKSVRAIGEAQRRRVAASAEESCWATLADQGLIFFSTGPIVRSATSVSYAACARSQ